MIESMTIRISQDDLLRSIWFGDGSGSHARLGIDALSPSDYFISSVELDGEDIVLLLDRVPDEEAPHES